MSIYLLKITELFVVTSFEKFQQNAISIHKIKYSRYSISEKMWNLNILLTIKRRFKLSDIKPFQYCLFECLCWGFCYYLPSYIIRFILIFANRWSPTSEVFLWEQCSFHQTSGLCLVSPIENSVHLHIPFQITFVFWIIGSFNEDRTAISYLSKNNF